LGCQGGDDPIPGAAWRKAECHLCLNCVGDCPESGLKFRLFPERAETVVKPDLKRRAVLGSLGGGAALVPLLRTTPGFAAERGEKNIRPPGALDEGPFLARCIRCGTCMKVCPNNALQPALGEAGVEGLWTPVVAPRIGYCASSCTLCGEVCPTGAIRQFTSKEKGWVGGAGEGQPIRIGTAFYDRGRCLPWAMARECIVCEEWCPTSPKAIYLVPAEAPDSAGQKATVRQPYIDPLRCVGCGACEYACPLVSGPAVYVTRVGESRSGRQEILGSRAGKADSWLPQSGEVAGWVRAGEPRIFAAEDLWKHIDGDAERYLKAGVRKTWNGRYRFEGRFEASADVYEMAGDEGAQAVFEAEPATGSREVAVGEAGRSFGQVLVFQRGRFLVRVVAYEEGAGVGEAVLGLGKGIERRLLRSADALRQP
jgi:formate hydrogenlyase subunit 6/NADH:ubiquinone oxidoreductase subunit I